MKHKKILVVVGAVALTAALAGGALALSGGDSLVSLSYLNNTFLPFRRPTMRQWPSSRGRMDRAASTAIA